MLTSARITLTHHRFEVGAAALAALVVGISALVVNYRLQSVGVPPGCFDAWLTAGGIDTAPNCASPVQAFATINEEEAGKIFAAMAVLPFAVGLLGGVPLVGRELETRTAQTAWSLSGSRVRWLGRQLLPVFVVLLVTVAFAALATDFLEATRQPWYHSAIWDMALHGPIVVGRAIAGLGTGLLVGAVIGRTLSAFIVGALAALVAVMLVSGIQTGWFRSHAQVILLEQDGSGHDDALQFEQFWLAPDGTRLDEGALMAEVPAANAENPFDWLTEHGYRQALLGLPSDAALGWVPNDVAIFSGLGIAGAAAAAFVVTRRRPA
ncbi:MAG TPA: hypothetical protein VFR93_04565 [Candidatus Limnocylindrales bacterium]|nr:hypothetical protein [Candidatus Limnocylindrales bacterium]